ncbi:MAG: hypothetical protein J5910_10060 [Lachnospiraceae bacterium]|nr:hypothetical protein [Lachnospiraceae bacterium]
MKRRLFATSIICFMMCGTLSGCSASADVPPAENPVGVNEDMTATEDGKVDEPDKEEPDNEEPEQDEPDKDEPDKDETDYEMMYGPVFAEVLEVLNNGLDYDREYDYISDGLMERVMYPGEKDLLDDIGYIMEDISGDGIPELMIGYNDSFDEDEIKRSYVLSVFTIADDKPYTVFSGWGRNRYWPLPDGHFYNSGSSGASNTEFGENHLSKDGTKVIWDDLYFSEEDASGNIGFFHNTSGVWDRSESEKLDIPDRKFWKLMDEYEERCILFSWTPMRERKSTADIDEVGEPYCGVLYWYKQLQESGKSWDEMEKYNSQTALVQHGWPYSTNNDEVRYVYQDITGDGLIELIITYYGDPVDIYSNDGDAVYAYGVPYRAIAQIYPDGMIMEGLTMGAKGWRETWYRYDNDTYKYVPLKEKYSEGMAGITFPEGKRITDVIVPEGMKLID